MAIMSSVNNDIHGQAIEDYFNNGEAETLWVHNTYGEKEEMPVEIFFREEEYLTEMELLALFLCRGSILDVGAAAGAISLILQNQGYEVTALELSSKCCMVMKQLGVANGIEGDLYDLTFSNYDTILLMMNGLGLAGKFSRLKKMIDHLLSLLNPGGKIIFDSSDVSYLFEDVKKEKGYYGDVSFQFEYKGKKGDWFDWLYLDLETMMNFCQKNNYQLNVEYTDSSTGQYLATIFKK